MKFSFSAFNIFALSTNLSLVAAINLRTEADARIVGGDDAAVGQYPYYVDLEFCGGTLISPTVILTAVHCEPELFLNRYVLVGAHKAHSETEGAEYIKVIDYEAHEDYYYNEDWETDPSSYLLNDVALLRLEKPYYLPNGFKLNIADESTENLQHGETLTAIGLGWLDWYSEVSPTHLQHVQLPFIDYDTCMSRDYYDGGLLQEGMNFCAGDDDLMACDGDSGGPILRIDSNNEHTLLGLVTWGDSCHNVNEPTVYERVAAYREWMHYVTCDLWRTEGGLCNGNPQGSNTDDDIEGCVDVEVTVLTGGGYSDDPENLRIIIQSDNEEVFKQNKLYSEDWEYSIKKCVDPDVCTRVVIRDKKGNGLKHSGHAEIKFDGNTAYSGHNFGSKVIRKYNC